MNCTLRRKHGQPAPSPFLPSYRNFISSHTSTHSFNKLEPFSDNWTTTHQAVWSYHHQHHRWRWRFPQSQHRIWPGNWTTLQAIPRSVPRHLHQSIRPGIIRLHTTPKQRLLRELHTRWHHCTHQSHSSLKHSHSGGSKIPRNIPHLLRSWNVFAGIMKKHFLNRGGERRPCSYQTPPPHSQ